MICDREIDNFYGEYERPERWRRKPQDFTQRRMKGMSIKKDCFAYRIGGCSVLTEMVCRRENCSFYKTKEQARADREKYGIVKDYRPGCESK